MTAPVRAMPDNLRADAPTNLIAIASGKGGVGKTWLAATLAHALARRSQRVLLFDGDLGLANVDIQLGLAVDADLAAAAAGRLDLTEALTRFEAGDFDVAAGKSGSASLANLHEARLLRLRDSLFALARRYDHVILDLGAGVDSTIRQMISENGSLFVVATDEPTSLTDAYALIKLCHRRYPHLAMQIVVNMAKDHQHGQRVYEKLKKACSNFLNYAPPLAGVIERDAKVPDAIRHQTASLIRHPSAPASVNVDAIAAAVMRARKTSHTERPAKSA